MQPVISSGANAGATSGSVQSPSFMVYSLLILRAFIAMQLEFLARAHERVLRLRLARPGVPGFLKLHSVVANANSFGVIAHACFHFNFHIEFRKTRT
jgi:hypothetical protein